MRQITATVEDIVSTDGPSPQPTAGALLPVESGPGVLVHLGADRRLATSQWLLAAHPEPRQARVEWQRYGVTLLPLGTLFSAVRLPLRLVLAVTGGTGPSIGTDAALAEVLGGGPVICDPISLRYYALVPATMPATWHRAADDWRVMDVDCLGRGTHLGVPRPDRTDCADWTGTYWAVPMESAGLLCAPLTVARFIATARQALPDETPR